MLLQATSAKLLHFLGELLVYASGMYKYYFSSGLPPAIVYISEVEWRCIPKKRAEGEKTPLFGLQILEEEKKSDNFSPLSLDYRFIYGIFCWNNRIFDKIFEKSFNFLLDNMILKYKFPFSHRHIRLLKEKNPTILRLSSLPNDKMQMSLGIRV